MHELTLSASPVREINIDSIQAPEPRSREEFLQCESQCLTTVLHFRYEMSSCLLQGSDKYGLPGCSMLFTISAKKLIY